MLLHLAGHGAVFAAVGENAQTLEAGLFDEIGQCLEMSRRLTRETHDEGRSQGDAGDAGPDPGDQVSNVLPRSLATHPSEHVVVNVLQRHVHIPRHFGALGDGPDQLVGPVGRVGVQKPDPEVALQRVQLAQQRAQRGGIDRQGLGGRFESFRRGDGPAVIGTKVEPVIGRILGDEVQFADAVGDQGLGLGHDVGLRPAAVRTAHPRDDAEAARMVAPLGDFHIGEVLRGEAEARGLKLRDVVGPHRDIDRGTGRLRGCGQGDAALAETIGAAEGRLFGVVMGWGLFFQLLETSFDAGSLSDLRSRRLSFHSRGPLGDGLIDQRTHLLHLVDAHEHIHLGHQLGQLVTVPLRHATGDDERLAAVRGLAQRVVLQDGVDRLLLRSVDEGARVDDDCVGLGRIVDDLDAFLEE